VSEPDRHIIAMGGGGFSQEPDNPLLDDYVLGVAREVRGATRPRVCFVPTASGDDAHYVTSFYEAFAAKAEASHLRLFARTAAPLGDSLLGQDLIYVGGGNTANMLALWRTHGVDEILREAWRRGIVLAGISAGSICWFEGGTTDSFGPTLAPIHDGLGLLAGSNCPHYDGEAQRRPLFHDLVAKGPPDGLPAGIAADDGAAIHFLGTEIVEVVASRPDARAYRVEATDGTARETELPTRFLGA
jgi:peptidase E